MNGCESGAEIAALWESFLEQKEIMIHKVTSKNEMDARARPLIFDAFCEGGCLRCGCSSRQCAESEAGSCDGGIFRLGGSHSSRTCALDLPYCEKTPSRLPGGGKTGISGIPRGGRGGMSGKILITRWKGTLVTAYTEGSRVVQMNLNPDQDLPCVGRMSVCAPVQNVVKNIQAAFVELTAREADTDFFRCTRTRRWFPGRNSRFSWSESR